MKLTTIFALFALNRDQPIINNHLDCATHKPMPTSNNDNWFSIRNANNNGSLILKPTRKPMDGYDHRPIIEPDNRYNITMNYLKMKLLKHLQRNDVSMQKKVETINDNEWLFGLDGYDNTSKYCVRLFAGDLLDEW